MERKKKVLLFYGINIMCHAFLNRIDFIFEKERKKRESLSSPPFSAYLKKVMLN